MSFLPLPLLKSFVGYDDLFEELTKVSQQKNNNYPAYDILKKNETNYIISLAVAGFSLNELEIILLNNFLIITGRKKENITGNIIHKGIANRSFEQKFKLEQFVEVKDASIENGILSINLFRNLPKMKEPIKIHIREV